MTSIIIIFFCAYFLHKGAQKSMTLDPGSIHMYVLFFTNLSVLLLYTFHFKFIDNHDWLLWSKDGMMDRVLILNAMYTLFFTFFYLLLIKIYHRIKESNNKCNYHFISLNEVSIIFLITLVIGFTLKQLSLDYVAHYWNEVVNLAFLLLFALTLSRIKSNRNVLVISAGYVFFSILIWSPFMWSIQGGGGYLINKGGAIATVLFSIIYIDITQKRGIFTQRNIFLAFLALPIALGLLNFIEIYISGTHKDFYELLIYMMQGYEVRMMENQAIILNSIDVDQAYNQGNTYLNALYDLVLPLENRNLSPMNWLSSYVTDGNEIRAQFGLSTIAEGVMNYNQTGVIIAALINAIILFILRSLFLSKWRIAPILFSGWFVFPYYLYRTDVSYILKKIEFMLISVVILLFLLSLVRFLFLSQFIKKRS